MRTAFLLSFALCCGCATVHQSMASRPWLQVKTEHFDILTDADQKQALKTAAELERYRRGLLLLWNPDANPADVTRVLMVRDRPELYEYVEGAVGGFFLDMGSRTVFVLSADQLSGIDSHDILVHELAHMVTHLVAPHPPHWLGEGLSEYLETTRINPAGEVAFGKPNRQSLSWLQAVGLMDLDRLWDWNPADKGELGQYYAAGWTLTHFLISERPQQFAVMMRELSAGHDGRSAWRAAFGDVPLSSHWQAVRDYAARGRWQLLTTQLPAVSESADVRVMSQGEVHAVLASLRAVAHRRIPIQERAEGVRKDLALAEQLDPNSPLVKDAAVFRDLMDHVAEVDAREKAAKNAPAVCPEDVVAEKQLGPGLWTPRTLTRKFDAGLLRDVDPGPGAVSDVREFYLAAGDVQVASGAPNGVPAIFVLRRAGPAGCVVNGWRDDALQATFVGIASWWEAKDRSQLLLLLMSRRRLASGPDELRWMALATDGKRAWWAARGPDGSPVLGGKDPRVRRTGGKMVLELAAEAGSGPPASYSLEVAGELLAAEKRPEDAPR